MPTQQQPAIQAKQRYLEHIKQAAGTTLDQLVNQIIGCTEHKVLQNKLKTLQDRGPPQTWGKGLLKHFSQLISWTKNDYCMAEIMLERSMRRYIKREYKTLTVDDVEWACMEWIYTQGLNTGRAQRNSEVDNIYDYYRNMALYVAPDVNLPDKYPQDAEGRTLAGTDDPDIMELDEALMDGNMEVLAAQLQRSMDESMSDGPSDLEDPPNRGLFGSTNEPSTEVRVDSTAGRTIRSASAQNAKRKYNHNEGTKKNAPAAPATPYKRPRLSVKPLTAP